MRPQFVGKIALLYFRSPHEVHPLIAKVWSHRLKDCVVIAANEDFIPGKVSYSIRTRTGLDLLDFMAKYDIAGEQIGYGLESVVDGTVGKEEFVDLLRRVGFGEGLKASA